MALIIMIGTQRVMAEKLLLITVKGLVLRGLCAMFFQPRKTKPVL